MHQTIDFISSNRLSHVIGVFLTALLTGLLAALPARAQEHGEARLSGTVTSLDGSPLPAGIVSLEPWSDDALFRSQETMLNAGGHFSLVADRAGLYRLQAYGVMHKTFTILLWIRQPGELNFEIRLDPVTLVRDRYFHKPQYTKWIRVFGSFNGFSYQKGVQFEHRGGPVLEAAVATSLDTLRYQLMGLGGDRLVFPGASYYEPGPENSFVAVIPVEGDSVRFTYRADSVYFRDFNGGIYVSGMRDPNQSTWTMEPAAEERLNREIFTFRNPGRKAYLEAFTDPELSSRSANEDSLMAYWHKIWREQRVMMNPYFHGKSMRRIENRLSSASGDSLTTPMRHVLYAGYVYSASYFVRYLDMQRRLQEIRAGIPPGDVQDSLAVNPTLLREAMLGLPLTSPLWMLWRANRTLFLDVLGHTPEVIGFMEELAEQYPVQDVANEIYYELLLEAHRSGNSDKSRRYYRRMVERFGSTYLSRQASDTLRQKK